MKKRLFKLSMLAFTLLAGFLSCGKKDDPAPGGDNLWGEVTFTINGDGYTNDTITIQAIPDSNDLSQGAIYFVKGKETYCEAGAMTRIDPKTGGPENEFTLRYYGTTPAKQAAGYKFPDPQPLHGDHTEFSLYLTRNKKSRDYIYNFGAFTTKTPGSVTITKYDAVYGRIEGTFEGTLIFVDSDNQYKETPVKITNGHFWFKRDEDNPF